MRTPVIAAAGIVAVCVLASTPPGGVTDVAAATAVTPLWDVAVAGSHVCHDGREFPQEYSSPAIGDLFGNGQKEVVAAFPDGIVRVYSSSGSLLWARDTGDDVAASPTLADLDGNGRLAVILPSYSGSVFIWDANGNLRPGWPQRSLYGKYGSSIQPGFFSSAAVGDLFGDGGKEIVASALDQHTYGWYADGQPLPGYPHLVADSALGTPALADLEHRHQLDIVTPSDNYATRGGKYEAYRPDGSVAWRQYVDEVPWASPAIENFGDGNYVTVNGTGEYWHVVNHNNVGHYVSGYNQNGSVRAGYPAGTSNATFGSPSVGDILNNGSRWVVSHDDSGQVNVFGSNGQRFPGTPFTTTFTTGDPGFFHGGTIIAPVDTPGRNGVWIPDGPAVYGYDVDGSGFHLAASIPVTGPVFSTPAEAAMPDGSLDMAITSDPSQVQCNVAGTWHLSFWKLNSAGSTMPAGAWPTFHGNNLRSGSNTPMGPPPPPHLAGVRGSDDQLWVTIGGGYSGFAPLGGVLTAAPAIAWVPSTSGGGSYLYVVTGTDHQLWARTDVSGWQHLSSASIYCKDNPALMVTGPAGSTTATVACEGSDLQLYAATAPVASGVVPSFAGFGGLGGVLTAGPAVALVAGQTTFFVTGTDQHAYVRQWGSGYSQYPWWCKGHPAAGSLGGRAYFACHGTDDQLWYATNNGSGWSGAAPGGGVLVDGPGVSVAARQVSFFGEGTDQALYEQTVSVGGQSTGWLRDGGAAQSGAGAA